VFGGDYAIWIVAFIVYLVDAAKLLSPSEFLLCAMGRGKFAPELSEAPLTLAGRIVAFGPVLQPDRAVFVLRWGDSVGNTSQLPAALERMADVSSALFPLRLVVIWISVWLFMAGPTLTFLLGPTVAIYVTIAAVYPAALIAGLLLWRLRERLRVSRIRIVMLVAEGLAFPPSLVNLVRKVTLAETVDVDGVQLALTVLDSGDREVFWERLQSRAEEMINDMEPQDPRGERLQSYIATARATL
jgi:hypothetical protein